MNLIFTSVIVVVVCVFQQCCCQCPPNTQYGKSCYIIPEAEANWIGAVRYCKALGANLASLDTKEENDFVVALINSTNKLSQLLIMLDCVTKAQLEYHNSRWTKTSLNGVSFYGYKNEFKSTSVITCATRCVDNSPCLSFSVQESSARCFIFSERVMFGVNMQVNEGFNHYWKLYDNCPVSQGYSFNSTANTCFMPVATSDLSWSNAALVCQENGGHVHISDTVVNRSLVYDHILREGPVCTIDVATSATYFYQPVSASRLLIMEDNTTIFSVESCNDAHILLSASDSSNDANLYEIVIGGWENTKSVIRKVRQGTILASALHVSLSCTEWRTFYVTWQNGIIEVGSVTHLLNASGNTSNFTPFLTYADSSPTAVHYVFVSGWDNVGKWRFGINNTFFLGATYGHSQGLWAWLDGSRATTWYPGRLDNQNNNQNCLECTYSDLYGDKTCYVTNRFVCQIPLD